MTLNFDLLTDLLNKDNHPIEFEGSGSERNQKWSSDRPTSAKQYDHFSLKGKTNGNMRMACPTYTVSYWKHEEDDKNKNTVLEL